MVRLFIKEEICAFHSDVLALVNNESESKSGHASQYVVPRSQNVLYTQLGALKMPHMFAVAQCVR